MKLATRSFCYFLYLFLQASFAAEEIPIITIKNHLFFPSEVEIKAHRKVKLMIINKDETAEQFESFDLNREKVIFPHQKSIIYIGPLKPGIYHFHGEFHPHSAQGVVIVKNIERKP